MSKPVTTNPLQTFANSVLPPFSTTHWTMRRKAQVVSAVRSCLLTVEEACERYRLSEEEFKSWMRLLDSHGVKGLRVTRTKPMTYQKRL